MLLGQARQNDRGECDADNTERKLHQAVGVIEPADAAGREEGSAHPRSGEPLGRWRRFDEARAEYKRALGELNAAKNKAAEKIAA